MKQLGLLCKLKPVGQYLEVYGHVHIQVKRGIQWRIEIIRSQRQVWGELNEKR